MSGAGRFWVKCLVYALLVVALPTGVTTEAFAENGNEYATVPAGQIDDVFDIANEEYKAGNYTDAIRLYRGLLQGSGTKTADIQYNLGNSYFKLHEYGMAIASYRRAQKLAPRDQDILANLRFARETKRDKIDQPRSTELMSEVFFFHYGTSRTEAETIFLCGYFAAAIAGSTYLFWKKKPLRWLTLGALVVTLIFGASTGLRWYQKATPNEAVVVVKETDVHTGPGDNYMGSFDLHDGTEVTTRKSENGWYQMELPDGRRGWIRESHLEII